MITYPFSLFIDIFVYLSNSFWVWGDHNETSHCAEEEIKTQGHRAVLSQKAPSSELSPRKQLSRLWSYGETGPTFLEDNLAFSQGWHSFMLFPPLPESCCHRVLLKQAGLRVAISINMVCLIVQCLLSTDCPWNTRCTSCQSITSSKRRTVSPCMKVGEGELHHCCSCFPPPARTLVGTRSYGTLHKGRLYFQSGSHQGPRENQELILELG